MRRGGQLGRNAQAGDQLTVGGTREGRAALRDKDKGDSGKSRFSCRSARGSAPVDG
jgi:hypothetical protein